MPITKLLTPRQIEVLHLIASGLTDAQIRARLNLHIGTINKLTADIRVRLGAKNRAQVIIICYENKLIPANLNQQFRLELTA